MRTRTLLLLAVTCGMLILIAGSIQLFRIAGQDTPTPPLGVGGTGRAGDAVVTVDSVAGTDTTFVVTVTLSGVDDTAGLAGFTLVGVDVAVKPLPAGDADQSSCVGFTVAPVQCTLHFDSSEFPTADRQLLLERADQRVRWRLV